MMNKTTNKTIRKYKTSSYLHEKALKDRLLSLLPSYGYFLLAAALLQNVFTYYGTRLITSDLYHHNVSTVVDRQIPLVTFFVLPYILAYLQWGIGYVMITRESKQHCFRVITAEILAKIITAIIFVAFPTTLNRPVLVPDGNALSELTALIYRLDSPDNLFPSIHCLESWFVFRGSLSMKTVPLTYKVGMGIMTIFVFLSTVFLKQHIIMDMIGAVVIAEVCLAITRKIF